mmetsp:Transcript_23158/g.68357  ORF Transcript_23158/g.68357 Transcript_23158/m.68357 type:complete len:223 (-) Transcript_23158:1050-1718(-)
MFLPSRLPRGEDGPRLLPPPRRAARPLLVLRKVGTHGRRDREGDGPAPPRGLRRMPRRRRRRRRRRRGEKTPSSRRRRGGVVRREQRPERPLGRAVRGRGAEPPPGGARGREGIGRYRRPGQRQWRMPNPVARTAGLLPHALPSVPAQCRIGVEGPCAAGRHGGARGGDAGGVRGGEGHCRGDRAGGGGCSRQRRRGRRCLFCAPALGFFGTRLVRAEESAR